MTNPAAAEPATVKFASDEGIGRWRPCARRRVQRPGEEDRGQRIEDEKARAVGEPRSTEEASEEVQRRREDRHAEAPCLVHTAAPPVVVVARSRRMPEEGEAARQERPHLHEDVGVALARHVPLAPLRDDEGPDVDVRGARQRKRDVDEPGGVCSRPEEEAPHHCGGRRASPSRFDVRMVLGATDSVKSAASPIPAAMVVAWVRGLAVHRHRQSRWRQVAHCRPPSAVPQVDEPEGEDDASSAPDCPRVPRDSSRFPHGAKVSLPSSHRRGVRVGTPRYPIRGSW